jgi:hypothetical protein
LDPSEGCSVQVSAKNNELTDQERRSCPPARIHQPAPAAETGAPGYSHNSQKPAAEAADFFPATPAAGTLTGENGPGIPGALPNKILVET